MVTTISLNQHFAEFQFITNTFWLPACFRKKIHKIDKTLFNGKSPNSSNCYSCTAISYDLLQGFIHRFHKYSQVPNQLICLVFAHPKSSRWTYLTNQSSLSLSLFCKPWYMNPFHHTSTVARVYGNARRTFYVIYLSSRPSSGVIV